MLQIWVECLGNDRRAYGQQNAQIVGRAMKRLRGWEMIGVRKFDGWGKQRVNRRKAA